MEIQYIFNARIPTEKAYGVNVVKTCEAIAKKGVNLTLVLPNRRRKSRDSLFNYYHIRQNFEVLYLSIIDAVHFNIPYGHWINQVSFSVSALLYSIRHKKPTIVLSRDEWTMLFLSFFTNKILFYDMHGFPTSKMFFWRLSMRRMDGIIVTNTWKIKMLTQNFNISREKIVLARNGYDEEMFQEIVSKEKAREKLGFPQDKNIVVYTGHLYDWKGAHILAESSQLLKDILILFVGGAKKEIECFEKQIGKTKNIKLLGQKPYHEIPLYLRAADVLVLPNIPKSSNKRFSVYSQFDTSPIKLFEYMASGRPIVASDLPSIREILNKHNSLLVEPDNAEALACGVKKTLQDSSFADTISTQAVKDVQQYSWTQRAESIIGFISMRITRHLDERKFSA